MKTKSSLLFLSALIIMICINGCLKEDDLFRPFTSFAPVELDDGWQLSTPADENVDHDALIQVYKDLYKHEKAWTLKSFLVFRNGKLIAESYLKTDADRTYYNAIWSCTKQITGIATGIAISEGLIESVNDPVSKYLPDEVAQHPDKKDITIDNLLTMRSGIFYDNGTETDEFRSHSAVSSVDYVLSNKLAWEPGTYYQYNDGAPQIISAIIQEATGMTLAQYTEQKFFSKIGLTKYVWRDYSDGITLGAFGITMPPRELAKVAQCVCNNGMWNGVQVIPEDWLADMLTPWVQNPDKLDFGYFWWINEERNVVYMHGHGGQFAIVYPTKNLVVVMTALEQVEDDFRFLPEDVFPFSDRVYEISN